MSCCIYTTDLYQCTCLEVVASVILSAVKGLSPALISLTSTSDIFKKKHDSEKILESELKI